MEGSSLRVLPTSLTLHSFRMDTHHLTLRRTGVSGDGLVFLFHHFSFFFPFSISQLEAMVGGALARASALHVGLGVGGTTIASGSRVRTSHSWTSRLLTSSFSLGISSLFCRSTQCM